MTTHDSPFVMAAFRLLLTITRHRLPTPLAISWREAPAPAGLRVQVRGRDFATWMHACDATPHQTSGLLDDGSLFFVRAEGTLRSTRRGGTSSYPVELVAVTEAPVSA